MGKKKKPKKPAKPPREAEPPSKPPRPPRWGVARAKTHWAFVPGTWTVRFG
jgi:hypothetical protein